MMGSIMLVLALIGGPFPGTYALQSGVPATAASLVVSPLPGDRVRFDIAVRRGGAIVKTFDLDMTQRMHVIVVSDDFRSFAHLHPRAMPNGHLVVEMAAPVGPYHVYADSEPHGFGQQVFRFDVGPGGGPSTARLRATLGMTRGAAAWAGVGAYVVRLSTLRLRAGSENTITLSITKNGRPANDLQPYLGAAGHAVFLNARDLTYVHVHPSVAGAAMAMQGMDMQSGPAQAGPHLTLRANVREPGTYRLWFEFRGGGRLYAAPFVLTVG